MIQSGIYQFKCLVNNKIYIGSSKNINERKNNHLKFLRKNKHLNKKFQRAFNKYGEENFIFKVLKIIKFKNNNEKSFLRIELIKKEQYYLNKLLFANKKDDRFNKLGYNICRLANSTLGFKMPKKIVNRVNKKLKENYKTGKVVIWSKDKKFTKEHKENLSKSKKLNFYSGKTVIWNKNVSRTKEEKLKMSKSKMGGKHWRAIKIVQLDINGNFIQFWDCIRDAARKCNIHKNEITNCCKGIIKSYKNFIWKYKLDYKL